MKKIIKIFVALSVLLTVSGCMTAEILEDLTDVMIDSDIKSGKYDDYDLSNIKNEPIYKYSEISKKFEENTIIFEEEWVGKLVRIRLKIEDMDTDGKKLDLSHSAVLPSTNPLVPGNYKTEVHKNYHVGRDLKDKLKQVKVGGTYVFDCVIDSCAENTDVWDGWDFFDFTVLDIEID